MMYRIRNIYIKQLYLFELLFLIGGLVYGMFYAVFLYKSFFDLKILIIDNLIFNIALWIGYILSCFIIEKLGYTRTIKIAALLFSFTSLSTFIFSDNIKTLFIVFSLLKGLSSGCVASVLGAYILKEIGKNARRNYYFLFNSIQIFLNIIFRLIIGTIIVYLGGYKITFLMSFFIYFIIIIIPLGHNKIPEVNFTLKDLRFITSQRLFKPYSLNKIISNGFDSLNAFIFAIVPFLILKNEFTLGIFTSFVGIFAAILSLIDKNLKIKKQLSLAF